MQVENNAKLSIFSELHVLTFLYHSKKFYSHLLLQDYLYNQYITVSFAILTSVRVHNDEKQHHPDCLHDNSLSYHSCAKGSLQKMLQYSHSFEKKGTYLVSSDILRTPNFVKASQSIPSKSEGCFFGFFGTKLLIKKEGPKKISFSEFARLKRGPKIRQSGCHEEPGSIIQILAKLFKSDPEKEEVPRWVRMM